MGAKTFKRLRSEYGQNKSPASDTLPKQKENMEVANNNKMPNSG